MCLNKYMRIIQPTLEVFTKILETTEHLAASARCKENKLPIYLLFGKEDPSLFANVFRKTKGIFRDPYFRGHKTHIFGLTPISGRGMRRQLPDAPFCKISLAGHFPHDEVPEVVSYLIRGWIKNLETMGFLELPLLDDDRQNSEINL